MRLADSWDQLDLTLSRSPGETRPTCHIICCIKVTGRKAAVINGGGGGGGVPLLVQQVRGHGGPVGRSAVSAIIINCHLNERDRLRRADAGVVESLRGDATTPLGKLTPFHLQNLHRNLKGQFVKLYRLLDAERSTPKFVFAPSILFGTGGQPACKDMKDAPRSKAAAKKRCTTKTRVQIQKLSLSEGMTPPELQEELL